MSTRQRSRPVTVEHLKEVCEREQSIALERKQRALEKHRKREEKLAAIEAQKLAHADFVQQSRKERIGSDVFSSRDAEVNVSAETRMEEVRLFEYSFLNQRRDSDETLILSSDSREIGVRIEAITVCCATQSKQSQGNNRGKLLSISRRNNGIILPTVLQPAIRAAKARDCSSRAGETRKITRKTEAT